MRERSNDFYSGRMFEADFLGSVRDTPEALARIRGLWDGESKKRVGDETLPYLSYRDALTVVREFQPGDPTNPKKELARELRLAVADVLGIPEDALDRVRFYTAVGSLLDKIHGVDGVIEVADANGNVTTATLDLSLRGEKQASDYRAKADVVIGDLPDPKEEEDAYLAAVDAAANTLAEVIRRQQERRGRQPPQRAAAAAP